MEKKLSSSLHAYAHAHGRHAPRKSAIKRMSHPSLALSRFHKGIQKKPQKKLLRKAQTLAMVAAKTQKPEPTTATKTRAVRVHASAASENASTSRCAALARSENPRHAEGG